MNHAYDGRLHEAEGAEITLSLSCGRAGYIFGSETLGISAEQDGTDWHPGSLVVALGKGMNRERLGINAEQALFGGLLGQALGHTLKQMMAAVCRKYNGFAALRHNRSRFALECNMANHLGPLVARNDGNNLAAFDPFPVPAR